MKGKSKSIQRYLKFMAKYYIFIFVELNNDNISVSSPFKQQ